MAIQCYIHLSNDVAGFEDTLPMEGARFFIPSPLLTCVLNVCSNLMLVTAYPYPAVSGGTQQIILLLYDISVNLGNGC